MIKLEKGAFTPEIERLLAPEPEKRRLQKEVVSRLSAYFDSVYEILGYKHPSCHTPIIVWMTKDIDNPQNLFQGPISLLFRLPPDWIMYDFRETNDERAGVIGKSSGELNPKMIDLLNLPVQELEALMKNIDERMKEIADEKKRSSIVESLIRWEQETGYCNSLVVTESATHDYESALKDLHTHYTEVLGNFSLS